MIHIFAGKEKSNETNIDVPFVKLVALGQRWLKTSFIFREQTKTNCNF